MNLFRLSLTLNSKSTLLQSNSRTFSNAAVRMQDTTSIAGTAPPYRCYVFLHSSISPSAFPAKLTTPFQRALQAKALQWGGFVNWVSYLNERTGVDPTQYAEGPHSATAFTMFGERIEIPSLSMDNIDNVNEDLKRRVEARSTLASEPDETHLFVCTHMARDCRCGEKGGDFVRELREEVERRVAIEPTGPYSRIRIGEVAHVGQHQCVCE